MGAELTIELVNHASVITKCGDFSLLTDPWYSGSCFDDNWGLKYLNPDALERAASASHLWISHPHEDHLHLPTLRRLVEQAPHLKVLANVSDNVNMGVILKKIGFTSITDLGERKTLEVVPGLKIARYPASRIDNMLLMKFNGWSVLNYNDCNLPSKALRALVRQLGPIDILLCNYNHAYKLWHNPSIPAVHELFMKRFISIVKEVKPKWVVPFASLHYYRSPYGADQNQSLFAVEDLAHFSPCPVLAAAVGDTVRFNGGEPVIDRRSLPIERSVFETKVYKNNVGWNEVLEACEKFARRLKSAFPAIVLWMPIVNIKLDDLDRTVSINLREGVKESPPEATVHMQTQSGTLCASFNKQFGIDSFWIGADFSFKPENVDVAHKFVMTGMLMDNGLAPRDLLAMPFQSGKWSFFFNRREEIASILSAAKFNLGERI